MNTQQNSLYSCKCSCSEATHLYDRTSLSIGQSHFGLKRVCPGLLLWTVSNLWNRDFAGFLMLTILESWFESWFLYRVFIKYCVFSLKCCDFSELCQFCCSAGVLPAWCVYTHWHWGKTERGQSPGYILKSSKKHNI